MGNYEKGKDRLSAGALFMLARFLGTSPAAFFEGLSAPDAGFAEAGAEYGTTIERPPQSGKLDAAFGRIRSQRDRALAVAIGETIAPRDDNGARPRAEATITRRLVIGAKTAAGHRLVTAGFPAALSKGAAIVRSSSRRAAIRSGRWSR